jgi:hypothetical protein
MMRFIISIFVVLCFVNSANASFGLDKSYGIAFSTKMSNKANYYLTVKVPDMGCSAKMNPIPNHQLMPKTGSLGIAWKIRYPNSNFDPTGLLQCALLVEITNDKNELVHKSYIEAWAYNHEAGGRFSYDEYHISQKAASGPLSMFCFEPRSGNRNDDLVCEI